jgi:hypothetical protein
MNMEEACQKALDRLCLDEIPPYASNLPWIRKRRMEFLSMVGQIMREESAKRERVVKTTAKPEDFV